MLPARDARPAGTRSAAPSRLDPDQIGSAAAADSGREMDGHIIFKCPRTGMNVQHLLDEKTAAEHSDSTYETVACKACASLHFINRTNGKLLGQD